MKHENAVFDMSVAYGSSTLKAGLAIFGKGDRNE